MNAITKIETARPRKEIGIEQLRAAIRYSARSGLIRRAHDVRAGKTGTGKIMAHNHDVAGTITALGYVAVNINGTKLPAHRIAWAYTFGEWPRCEIDHVNGDKTDNRIDNLRLADRVENCRNAAIRRDNSSGFKGVTFRRSTGRWVAQISDGIKRVHIGCFHSAEEAALAYDNRARVLHGAFATLNFPRQTERSIR